MRRPGGRPARPAAFGIGHPAGTVTPMARWALGATVRGVRALCTFGSAALLAALIALASGGGAPAVAGASPARPGTAVASPHPTGHPWYYVAVGASESVGFQPVPGTGHGERTDQGYTNDLVSMESARWPGLELVELGCPGITAQGALDGTGACRYPAGSEIATAVQFLEEHPGRVAFVTVDLGFNDIWPCLVHHAVDESCVSGALAEVTASLDTTLADLRAAGGQHLLIVGLEHDDPYIADAAGPHAGLAYASKTVAVFARLNDALDSAYRAAGAVVARVPDAFAGLHARTLPPPTSKAVAQTCTDTWMCSAHNIHPTAAGYRAIAEAVAAAIASRAARGG